MIREVTLNGPPRQRGRAHGEELRPLIAETLDGWLASLAPRTDPRAFTHRVMHEAGFLDPVATHTPDLLEEVRGIAEGSAQPVEVVFAWQLIDECWWYLDELDELNEAGGGTDEPREACSAMAVNDGSRGIVAQTQDLPRAFDGSQVVLRYQDPDGLEILVPSAAGLLAYNGVNSAGLAACITTLSELAHQTAGVSSGFIMPSLLRCRTVDDALDWLRRTPIASGNSFTLGSRSRSVVAEVSATDVAVVDDGQRALHTNHALALPAQRDFVRFAGSVERLDQLQAAVTPTMTVDDVAALYGGGPVCRSRASEADALSVGTMIFELDGPTPRCHAAPGPLDTDALTTFEMSP